MSQIWFNSSAKGTNVRVLNRRQQTLSATLRFFWRWMPDLSRKMLTRLFMSTTPYSLSEQESACLERGRPFRINVHGKSIHAWQWGSGPGVLMVHGWNGSGAQFHRFVDPIVRAGYTAIAIDGPGHGRSPGRDTSYFEFTDVVRAFLAPQHGLNIKAVIGHSFGAAAIINSLEKERLPIRSVCIAPILRLKELLGQVFTRFGVPQEIHTAIIGDFESRFGYNMMADNPINLIGRLSAPVLIIHDVDDRSAVYADSKHQAQAHGQVTLMTTRELGHRRILSDDQVIRTALAHIQAPSNEGRIQNERSDTMSIQQALIDQYAAANEDQRLGLYMIHRELREDFIEIDMAGAVHNRSPAKPASKNRCRAYFHQCCLGWSKP